MTTSVSASPSMSFRVADFGNRNLPLANVLPLAAGDLTATISEIRRYADLPFLYVLDTDQVKTVTAVLARLKEIRSTCYPYALFVVGDTGSATSLGLDADALDLDVIAISPDEADNIAHRISEYAASRFSFDHQRLKFSNADPIPRETDVLIVGAGVTGLYAARKLERHDISFCVVDKRDEVGGIWSQYANTTSQVNSSEGSYRLVEKSTRSNRDHSMTREILEDIVQLAGEISDRLFMNIEVKWVRKGEDGYEVEMVRDGQPIRVKSKGIILAINDRVGTPRTVQWENEAQYQGKIITGISDEALGVDWRGKQVAIIGMGAFAIENARTALEGGADRVTVICRRHGTVCPKIIDYLNFATPYDENFQHANKSNMRNMLLWKNLYKRSGATEPECWMGNIKHPGHTISVSDIWFVAHHLKKLGTLKGTVTGMFDRGIIVDNQERIEADVVVNCVGFHRNASSVKGLCDYTHTYNVNYLDKDVMYLADAYIDDNAFNSFFGSSVLEMAKFYMDVYVRFFDTPEFATMIGTQGIEPVALEERSWSHYIAGANALIKAYPEIRQFAQRQVETRTENFLEAHDLEVYIAENRREWIDMHTQLAGRPVPPEECLPYVFEKLLESKT